MGNKGGRRARKQEAGGGPPAFDPAAWPHGCTHYRRRCQVVAPCCGLQTWCRLCHDAAYEEGRGVAGHDAHKMDRHAVAEVVCCTCNERQPVRTRVCFSCAVCARRECDTPSRYYDCGGDGYVQAAQACTKCGTVLGRYFCAKCNLYDDNNTKGQFHCDKCGICRYVRRDPGSASKTKATRRVVSAWVVCAAR